MMKFLSLIALSCLLFLCYETVQSYLLISNKTLTSCGEELPEGSIPVTLASAVIAQEDQSFLNHGGVSWGDLKRAIIGNLYHKKVKFGASTIDMQVASICYLQDLKLNRWREKIREVLIVKFISLNHSKQEILRAYLSYSPLGKNVRGFVEASSNYYKKPLQELSFNEEWRLVITLRNSKTLNPTTGTLPKPIVRDWLRAKLRQNYVLESSKDSLLAFPFIEEKSF